DGSGAVAEVGVVPIILAAVVVLVDIVAISLLVVTVVLSARRGRGLSCPVLPVWVGEKFVDCRSPARF
ncbi:MAG TPA: hypothetical protein VF788_15755, partial [Pseudonocardiaceae bacterium]